MGKKNYNKWWKELHELSPPIYVHEKTGVPLENEDQNEDILYPNYYMDQADDLEKSATNLESNNLEPDYFIDLNNAENNTENVELNQDYKFFEIYKKKNYKEWLKALDTLSPDIYASRKNGV